MACIHLFYEMCIRHIFLFWAVLGGLAVAVPGELYGYYELHKEIGKLQWSTLFESAINIAYEGFPLGPNLAHALESSRRDMTSRQNMRLVMHAWYIPCTC